MKLPNADKAFAPGVFEVEFLDAAGKTATLTELKTLGVVGSETRSGGCCLMRIACDTPPVKSN